MNKKTVIAPFEIDGLGTMNNDNIDSNELVSVYGKGNIIKQLADALEGEAKGNIQVFYWNKKEALTLLQAKGLQLPSSLPQDGFVHSIREKGAKINIKFKNVTETQQFKRWFGKSKVVNADGTPLIMYHGTSTANGEFFTFDSSQVKKRVGLGLKQLGKGNYFTRSDLSNSERYDRILPVYLSIKKPFIVKDDFMKEVESKLGIDTKQNSYDEIQNLMRAKGYDGVIKCTPTGNIGIAVTFDSEQVKSATDNIGTFDGNNPDIRYKRPGVSEKLDEYMSDFGEATKSTNVKSLQEEKESTDWGRGSFCYI